MKFIECLEVKDKSIIVQKETANDAFEKLEEGNLEPDSLIKCRIRLKGLEASKKYSVGELILVSADKVRTIKHYDCPKDIFVIYNEDLIFSGIKE